MQTEQEFLECHHKADVIVVDSETKLPAYAEYLYLNAEVRRYPAVYRYPEY